MHLDDSRSWPLEWGYVVLLNQHELAPLNADGRVYPLGSRLKSAKLFNAPSLPNLLKKLLDLLVGPQTICRYFGDIDIGHRFQ